MKKILLALALLVAGVTHADSRNSYVFVDAQNLMNGDGFTRPLGVVTADGPYIAQFKGNTVLALGAATGTTFTASFTAPTGIKAGGSVRFGIVVCYGGITNSAGVSATSKVQSTTYADAYALTATTTVAYTEVFLNDAGQYGRPTMVDIGTISNVYPGNVIQLFFNRSTGSNQVLNVYSVYAIFEPVKGWLW